MKKILMAVLGLCAAGMVQVSALGIGIAGGLPLGEGLPGTNVMLSIKPTEVASMPLLGIGISAETQPTIAIIADWWLLRDKLVGPLGVYVGVGAYGAFYGDQGVGIGGRLPIGLNIYITKWLEIFAEATPTLGWRYFNNYSSIGWGLQSSFGFRFWV